MKATTTRRRHNALLALLLFAATTCANAQESFASVARNTPAFELFGGMPLAKIAICALVAIFSLFLTLYAIVKLRGVSVSVFKKSALVMLIAIPLAVIPPAFLCVAGWAFFKAATER